MTNRIELPVVDVAKADLKGIGVALKLPDSSGRPPDVENQIIRFFGKLGVYQLAGTVSWHKAAPITAR